MNWNFSHMIVGASTDRGSWERELASSRRTIVEVGFGNGEFTEHKARSEPESLVVGFEVSQWCLTKAARRMMASGAENARLSLGDARALLGLLFPPASIDVVYMNFPCPWPKNRHADRRVTGAKFASALSRALKPGGTFELATDVDWYAEETDKVFGARSDFKTFGVERDPEREYLTKYERKWRAMGRETFAVKAERLPDGGLVLNDPKNEDNNIEDNNIEEDNNARPCAPTKATLAEAIDALRSLSGVELSGPDWVVVFKDLFVAENGVALLHVISSDEGFEQHYHIKLAESAGALRGKLDPVGCPFRTPGVRASIRHVARSVGVKF